VPARVSPVERIRAQIDQLFATDRDLGEVLEDVARLGARLLLQTALEVEVTEFLGRDRYARGERARAGHRNGHAELTSSPPPGPSPWRGPSCAARASRSPPGCWARARPAPTRWSRWSSPDSSAACRSAMSKPRWRTRSGHRQRCRSRPSARSAKRSRTSSPPGASGGWTTSSSTICTWTARISSCTPARVPSRSWSPGPSPPMVRRCCWAWPRPPARPTTPGPTSWPAWSGVGCGRRC
jgi:hypothetical protein